MAKLPDPRGRPSIAFGAIEPGQEVGSFSYELDERTVSRHLQATQQAPPPAPFAPVSLLAADGVNLADRHYDISQSVHAAQRLEVLAPPRLGSTLAVRGLAAAKWARKGRRYVEIETETVDETGLCIATGVTTGVVVYRDAVPDQGEPPPRREPPLAEGEPIETLGPLERTMTREAMILYEPEGEVNLHTNDEVARAVGLPASIATGTLFLAYVFDLLSRCYGPESVAGTTLDVRIRIPVFAGDRIATRGEVMERSAGRDRLRVACEGPRGAAIVGTASVPSGS
jgi:acyl dehydratase